MRRTPAPGPIATASTRALVVRVLVAVLVPLGTALVARVHAEADGVAVRGMLLEVGPRTVPCGVEQPRRCFEARGAGEAQWRPFEGTVDGYRHRDGHAAVVLVLALDDTVVGDFSGRYALVHVVSELPFAGATWVLERHGRPAALEEPLPDVDVWFTVVSGGAYMEGSAGCNQFSAQVAWSGDDELELGPFTTTLRACEEPVMRQEAEVLAALADAARVSFYGDTAAFAGDELRARFRAEPLEPPLTWTQGPGDPEVVRFNRTTAAALAAGERWPIDPLRVALAFVDSRGAPRVVVERRDDRTEEPTLSLVHIDEDGFLDDSVRGARTEVVLVPGDAGAWEVWAASVVTRCWRTERLMVAPGELCP